MIKLGLCTSFDNARAAKEMGFDYIELGFSGTALMDDASFIELLGKVDASPIKVEAMNVMLPGSFRLTGENADLTPIPAYLTKGFARAALLGCKVVVFGSGGARNVPEGFPIDQAYDQIAAYLTMANELAAKEGITIAIEPLNFKECNILNFVSEAATLAGRVNLPSVKVLADGYHMAMVNEPNANIVAAGSLMAHCHVANPVGRIYPAPNDGHDYVAFFAALKEIGYEGRVSVEAGCKDFAIDAPNAFETLDAARR